MNLYGARLALAACLGALVSWLWTRQYAMVILELELRRQHMNILHDPPNPKCPLCRFERVQAGNGSQTATRRIRENPRG